MMMMVTELYRKRLSIKTLKGEQRHGMYLENTPAADLALNSIAWLLIYGLMILLL